MWQEDQSPEAPNGAAFPFSDADAVGSDDAEGSAEEEEDEEDDGIANDGGGGEENGSISNSNSNNIDQDSQGMAGESEDFDDEDGELDEDGVGEDEDAEAEAEEDYDEDQDAEGDSDAVGEEEEEYEEEDYEHDGKRDDAMQVDADGQPLQNGSYEYSEQDAESEDEEDDGAEDEIARLNGFATNSPRLQNGGPRPDHLRGPRPGHLENRTRERSAAAAGQQPAMSTPIDIDYSFEHVELAPNVENCVGYDVTPFASCVHPTGINCVATTRNMRWIFTGGDDGYIRKFDFAATLFGGQILTQTQKHGLVDSIEKAGVLTSAWENQEFPASFDPFRSQQSLSDIAVEEWSPVYSIEVESEGVWCLSGCRSGNINLWSVRHDEGACRHVFRGHTSAVSVLKLTPGERGVISGSWDKTLLRWDLETGNIVRYFQGVTSLVTSASFSPTSASSYTIDPAIGDTRTTNVHPTAEDSLMMVTTYDGTILLYDQRDPNNVTRKFLPRTSGSSPWAYNATWSADGRKIYCGRRNNTVDVYDVAENRYVRNLKFPNGSGHVWAVSCMPNNRHLMCASQDILRLWDLDVATPSSDAPPAPSPSPIVAHPTSQSNDSGPNSTPGTPVTNPQIPVDQKPSTDTKDEPAPSTSTDPPRRPTLPSTSLSSTTPTAPPHRTSRPRPRSSFTTSASRRSSQWPSVDKTDALGSSANNTPKLPTAGLGLFLDESMNMSSDSLLGQELSLEPGSLDGSDEEDSGGVESGGAGPGVDGDAMDITINVSAPAGSNVADPASPDMGNAGSLPPSPVGGQPSPAGDGKLLDPASAGGAGGVVITAGSTRTATTANLGRTASLLSAKEDELETPPLVPFTILPGHNGGVVSALIIDPSKRYMLTASGTRGWDGTSSNQCLLYCIDPVLAPAAAADDPAATPGADGAVGAGDEMDVDPVVVVVPDRVVGEEDVEDVEEGMVEQMVG